MRLLLCLPIAVFAVFAMSCSGPTDPALAPVVGEWSGRRDQVASILKFRPDGNVVAEWRYLGNYERMVRTYSVRGDTLFTDVFGFLYERPRFVRAESALIVTLVHQGPADEAVVVTTTYERCPAGCSLRD